jgi:hypothetical protein
MLSNAEIPLIDSSGDSPALQLFIKNLRQEVKAVKDELEQLQESFDSLGYYSETNSRSESRTSIVSFSTVQVREYNVTMGDYRSGPQCPLTLGWEHGPSRTYNIDTFSKKKERQHRNILEKLPLYKRQDRLRAMGYSKEEVVQTWSRKRRVHLALDCVYNHGSFSSTTRRPREDLPRRDPGIAL